MKTLKHIGLSLTFIAVLATAVSAGETPSPPYLCGETGTPPCTCTPGETHGPPCSAQSMTDDSTDPGETQSPPAMLEFDAVDVTDITETVMWALSLF